MDKNGILRCGVVQMLSIKVPLTRRMYSRVEFLEMFQHFCITCTPKLIMLVMQYFYWHTKDNQHDCLLLFTIIMI